MCPTADPRCTLVGPMTQVWYDFGVSCVFPQQRGIPAQGSTCAVALLGEGQPLLSPHPSSQKFHQEGQPVWTSTQTAFNQSMLTIPIISWALKCLAKVLLSTSAFSILSVTTQTSFLFIIFYLPQILPSVLKVAHICRITFIFLYDPFKSQLKSISFLILSLSSQAILVYILHFKSSKRSLLSHEGLLLSPPPFCSTRWFLPELSISFIQKSSIFHGPYVSVAASQEILLSNSPKWLKFALLKS